MVRFKQLQRETQDAVDKVRMAGGKKSDELESKLDELEKEIEEFLGRLSTTKEAKKLKDLLDTVK